MPNQHASFLYTRSPDQDRPDPAHHVVIIAGAGPVGLVLALDLAARGIKSVVIEKRTRLSEGSRAICWAKRTLEIMDRLGLADELVAEGVTWQRGKVFHRDAEVFAFDLLPEAGHKRPAFINLQQFRFEDVCIQAAARTGLIDIRWGHEIAGLEAHATGAELSVTTPEGPYRLSCDWLVAADGARSSVRRAMGLGFVGQTFNDQFLICDIKMQAERPTERWFWFDPPFNPGQSALLHRQAGNVWRLDFQIGPDADRDAEMQPENVARRVRGMLGDIDFAFEWISCYRFQCRRIEKFRHGRVLFAGDAAHQVSPFGARGGNSGVQDADNLGWKLALVLGGQAPHALLDSYDAERRQAADENILNSTRATDFISPKGPGAIALRDAVLDLAATEPFARRLLNSGRLSLPATYDGSLLNGQDGFGAGEVPALRPGAAAIDAPLGNGWLLDELGGAFTLLRVAGAAEALSPVRDGLQRSLTIDGIPVRYRSVGGPEIAARYGAVERPADYLIRPDQHVAARWREITDNELAGAVLTASGR
ncbi:MAG: FAD-dependent oxidoreductase [Hyphomicrobiaceae bacterium]